MSSIKGFEEADGLPYRPVQLGVGHIVGTPDARESIYLDPEYLENRALKGTTD